VAGDAKAFFKPLHDAADVGNLEIWQFIGKVNTEYNNKQLLK
jgi:hypothetical protein